MNGPDLGIAVLGNRTDSRPDSLAREVVKALVEDFEEPKSEPEEDEEDEPEAEGGLSESPVPLERYVGQYYSPELGTTYRLVTQGGELVATHRQVDDQMLRPEEKDVFTTEGVRGPLTLTFQRDEDGEISGYHLAGRRFSGVIFRKLELDGS